MTSSSERTVGRPSCEYSTAGRSKRCLMSPCRALSLNERSEPFDENSSIKPCSGMPPISPEARVLQELLQRAPSSPRPRRQTPDDPGMPEPERPTRQFHLGSFKHTHASIGSSNTRHPGLGRTDTRRRPNIRQRRYCRRRGSTRSTHRHSLADSPRRNWTHHRTVRRMFPRRLVRFPRFSVVADSHDADVTFERQPRKLSSIQSRSAELTTTSKISSDVT